MCLWFPGLEWSLLFLITKAGKMSKLVISFTLELFAGHWKPSTWIESLHLKHLSLFWWAFLTSNHFLCWLGTWKFLLPWFLWFDCLDLREDFFFFYIPAARSVHWCLSRLICVACGSPATCLIWCVVAFELSIHFASCLTLLAGNMSKSTFPSLMVLEKNSSSCRKNQKMSLCKILAVSGGILPGWLELVPHCTIHQHSCCLV